MKRARWTNIEQNLSLIRKKMESYGVFEELAELQTDMHKDEGLLEVVLCYSKQSRGKRGG